MVNMMTLVETEAKISLNATTRTPSVKTMRLVGRIGNDELVILVDFESTHNFLDPIITRMAKLKVNYTSKVVVKIINENLINSEGNCSSIITRIQGIPFIASFIY